MSVGSTSFAPPPLPDGHPVYGDAPPLPGNHPVHGNNSVQAISKDGPLELARETLGDLISNYDIGGIRDFFKQGVSAGVMEGLSRGHTPLHEAAILPLNLSKEAKAERRGIEIGRSFEVVATLMQYLPAEALNAKDDDGRTPLMYAAKAGQSYSVNVLSSAGADSTVKDNNRWTALCFAAFSGAVDTIKSILSFGYLSGTADAAATPKASIDERDNDGNTAFMIAAKKGNVGALTTLLEVGADINAINENGQTALMLAALSGADGEAAYLALIAAGADQTLVDQSGNTARHYEIVMQQPPPPLDVSLA